MTSQVAVFNLACVAVASDSMMTLRTGYGSRTLASAEKIFDLGSGHRVVVMTSGNAEFMAIPWSVLIGEWSQSLERPEDRVSDYASGFWTWLNGRADLFDADRQEEEWSYWLEVLFRQVRDAFLVRRQHYADARSDPPTSKRRADDVAGHLREAIERWRGLADVERVDRVRDEKYVEESSGLIREAFESVFKDIEDVTLSTPEQLAEVARLTLAKDVGFSSDATVAFIGYGAQDVFPAQHVVVFRGVVNGTVRAVSTSSVALDVTCASLIHTFAQRDAIDTFLFAHHDAFLDLAHDSVTDLYEESKVGADFTEAVSSAHRKEMDRFVGQLHERLDTSFLKLARERFVDPLLTTIESLSRSDMSRLAESLVGIQALRADSLGQMPTVGGPIDVVVVSGTYGVEWIHKRSFPMGSSSFGHAEARVAQGHL